MPTTPRTSTREVDPQTPTVDSAKNVAWGSPQVQGLQASIAVEHPPWAATSTYKVPQPTCISMDNAMAKTAIPEVCAQASAMSVPTLDAACMETCSEDSASIRKQGISPRTLGIFFRKQRRQIWIIAGVVLMILLAGGMMFGLTFAANTKSKDLFLSPLQPKLVDRDGELVSVASAKVAVPLGLAPFLSQEQLRDIEVLGFFDCQSQEEVWGRVLSVRRYAPAEPIEEDSKAISQSSETVLPGNYSVSFLLATGQYIVVDAEGEYIDFPEENRTQELCGELQCAQLHVDGFDVAKLEAKADAILGASEPDSRRLQRRGGRGRRGRQCRQCGRTSPPRRRPTTPRRPPAPAPTPATCSASITVTTEAQRAVLTVARGVCNMLATAGSRENRAILLGGIVRLAFHDAGTFDGTSGGADGCVDLTAIENRGINEIIEQLAPVASSVSSMLSRADVWALAAAVAVEAAGGPQLSFSSGRVDSESCAGHSTRLPDAELGHAHIREVFVDRLGFSEKDVVALLGAHVLGAAEMTNSGYSGAWVPRNDVFSNAYFRDLLVRPWNKASLNNFEGLPRTQWNGPRNTMMLNTDIELAFDTSGDCSNAGGRSGARQPPGRCPRAGHGFSDAVTEFSTSQDAFFQAFAPAFERLLALGAESLQCVFPDCSTPGPL